MTGNEEEKQNIFRYENFKIRNATRCVPAEIIIKKKTDGSRVNSSSPTPQRGPMECLNQVVVLSTPPK